MPIIDDDHHHQDRIEILKHHVTSVCFVYRTIYTWKAPGVLCGIYYIQNFATNLFKNSNF